MTETDASWGDIEEDESEQTGTKIFDGVEDETGTRERIVVEYTTDAEGKKFKNTKKYKVFKQKVRVNVNVQSRIANRKKIKKFGVCEGKSSGPEVGITMLADPAELETVARRKQLREEEATKQEVEKKREMAICKYRSNEKSSCEINDERFFSRIRTE